MTAAAYDGLEFADSVACFERVPTVIWIFSSCRLWEADVAFISVDNFVSFSSVSCSLAMWGDIAAVTCLAMISVVSSVTISFRTKATARIAVCAGRDMPVSWVVCRSISDIASIVYGFPLIAIAIRSK